MKRIWYLVYVITWKKKVLTHNSELEKNRLKTWPLWRTWNKLSSNIDSSYFNSNHNRNKPSFRASKVHEKIRSSRLGVFCKKVFLEISQNSQENTCTRVCFLIKKLWHRCFPVNFAKFLRTPFYRTLLDDCF